MTHPPAVHPVPTLPPLGTPYPYPSLSLSPGHSQGRLSVPQHVPFYNVTAMI